MRHSTIFAALAVISSSVVSAAPTANMMASSVTTAEVAADNAAPAQAMVESRWIFICDGLNNSGNCQYIEVYDNICLNFAGKAKSLNQDDKIKSTCDLYASRDCKGATMSCSGDCGTLFVFNDNLQSFRCFW